MSNPSLTNSLHARYRRQLMPLAGEDTLPAIINRSGARRGWWDGDLAWKSSYGHFFPGDGSYAALVFAALQGAPAKQELCTVACFDHKPSVNSPTTEVVQDDALGWLALTRFPEDARLPSLATVLTQAKGPTVVRYHPGKRCTIRFAGDAPHQELFAKVFPDKRGQQLHIEATALWEAAVRGEIELAVARPLRWDAAIGALWQGRLAGDEVQKELFGPNGAQLAARMGSAAASLASSTLTPKSTFDRSEQLRSSHKKCKELCRRVPWLAGAVGVLMRQLTRLHESAPPYRLYPIHGAPHAHQWLSDGDRLGLVDFDGFTLGDRELDVATFVSEIDFEKPAVVEHAALNRAFVAGYEAVAGPLNQSLLQAYCVHKRIIKALKFASAIHPEGDVRAEQAVGRALISSLSDHSAPRATRYLKEFYSGEIVQ